MKSDPGHAADDEATEVMDSERPDNNSSEKTARPSKAEGGKVCSGQPHVNRESLDDLSQSFIDAVQPLPSGGRTRNESAKPGAHAVATRPCFAPNQHVRLSPTPSFGESTVADDVVLEAVVCSDEEASDKHPEALPDPEKGMMKMDEEVVDGKIIPADSPNGRQALFGWLFLLCILVVGLSVLLPVLLSSSGSGGKPDEDTNEAPRPLFPPFLDDLPTSMVHFIEDPQHPHSFANTWMWQDPHKNTYAPERQIQRFHLASFYFSTNGDHWFQNDGWLSYDVSECDWFSQHHNDSIPRYDDYDICDENNVFQVLNLASNNLQGNFPLVKSFIESLRTYDVSNNNISGLVPSSSTPVIEVFVISNNKFEGLLVAGGTFDAFGLRVAKMDGNQLYGEVELVFMVLPKLEVADISGNHFSGAVPKSAAMCKNLTSFKIANNEFEGTIPSELSALTKLQEIDVSGNPGITGTIPSELGLLALSRLDVSGTAVSGDVPDSLCAALEADALDFAGDCGPTLECCRQ